MTAKTTLDLSIVLPSYRGAQLALKHVPVLQAYLEDLGLKYEVLLVDDGSDDGGATQAAATELGCVFLENPHNQGKGAAVRRGMLAATGRFRIYTDVDVPYELPAIERMVDYLGFKEFHLAVGDRTLEDSSYFTKMPRARVLASHVYSAIVGGLVVGGRYDTQCGLKGFRDHVAEDLFSVGRVTRFAFDVELFCIALQRGYDIKRVPVQLRTNATSSINLLRDSAVMLKDLGAIRLNQFRGRYAPRAPVEPALESAPEAPNDRPLPDETDR